jgi:hypothetical protein
VEKDSIGEIFIRKDPKEEIMGDLIGEILGLEKRPKEPYEILRFIAPQYHDELVALGHGAEHRRLPKKHVEWMEKVAKGIRAILKDMRDEGSITQKEYKECLRYISSHMRIIRKAAK